MQRTLFSKFLTLALLLTTLPFVSSCSDSTAPGEPNEMKVGALVSLTGPQAEQGKNIESAMKLAEEDVNAYLASINSNLSLYLQAEDTKLDPEMALEALSFLSDDGFKIVIGPQTSAEMAVVKPFADENGIVMLSPSGATATATANDNLIELLPSASSEATAISALLDQQGIMTVVPVYRTGGPEQALSTAIQSSVTAGGGSSHGQQGYDAATLDGNAVIASINQSISELLALDPDSSKIAVVLTGGDEAIAILSAAQGQPLLSKVRWYLAGPIAGSPAVINDAGASSFSMTAVTGSRYSLDRGSSARRDAVAARIKAQTGRDADAGALAAYDAVWIAARTYLTAGTGADIEVIKVALPKEAEAYNGITGPVMLDAGGARRSNSFDFWSVQNIGGEPRWVVVARYEADPAGGQGRIVFVD